MLKKRLIPILLLQNGLLVRSESFSLHQIIGNPVNEVERFNEWNVDELIYLDITTTGTYDQYRDDQREEGIGDPLQILKRVSKSCFMPLTWGGRIQSEDQMHECFRCGADKITLNTAACQHPDLITNAAKRFGSQAIVVSIDIFRSSECKAEVFIKGGVEATGKDPVEWAKEVESRGCGEILIQSIDRDGSGRGYDLEMINKISNATSVPIIACSGVALFDQYAEGIEAGADAVAAANIWHFKELADKNGKRAMARAGIEVRG